MFGVSKNVNECKIVQNIGYYIGNIGIHVLSKKCAIDYNERAEDL